MSEIIAAADGSALGNPGPAGWAWYIDDNHWAAGGWEHGTNNMGELKAVLDLFEATVNCCKSWMLPPLGVTTSWCGSRATPATN